MAKKIFYGLISLLIFAASQGYVRLDAQFLREIERKLDISTRPLPPLPVIYYPDGAERKSNTIVSKDPYSTIYGKKQ